MAQLPGPAALLSLLAPLVPLSVPCCAVALSLSPAVAQTPFQVARPLAGPFSRTPRLTTCDVDHDGRDELLLLERGSAEIRVSFTRSDGTSELARHLFSAPEPLFSIGVGDVNNDGLEDLVAITMSYSILSLLRVGDEWLPGPSTTFFAPGLYDSDVTVFDLVDLNGDGSLDFAVTTLLEAFGSPYGKFLAGAGDGSFGVPEPLLINGPSFYQSRFADVNGDGALDLVVIGFFATAAGDSHAVVILNNGTFPFDGAAAVPIGTTALGYIRDFVLADEEGDGDLDVFFLASDTSGSRVEIASGDGQGGFGAPQVALTVNALFPQRMEASDLDGDGDADLLFSRYFSSPINPALVYSLRGPQGYPGPSVTATNSPTAAEDLVAADLVGGGSLSVVTSGYNSSHPGLGSFDGFAELRRFDLDASGVLGRSADSVISEPTARREPELAPLRAGEGPSIFQIDPVTRRLEFKRNLGENEWGPGAEIAATADQRLDRFVIGDVNGDGNVDVLFPEWFNPGLNVFCHLGDGNGGFGPRSLVAAFTQSPGMIIPPRLVDIDDDGDLDVFARLGYAGFPFVALNDGTGQFAQPFQLIPANVVGLRSNIEDFNGDGISDLLFTNQGRVDIAFGLGGGSFGTRTQVLTLVGNTSLQTVADLNSDGALDLFTISAVSSTDRQLRAAFGLGNGTFGPEVDLALIPSALGGYRFADVDLDGDTDILLIDLAEQTYSVLRNDGPGTFITPLETAPLGLGLPGSAISLITADTDLDGDVDVLTHSQRSNRPMLLLENLEIDEIADAYCGAAVPNSTGSASVLGAAGSPVVGLNRLLLACSSLPAGVTGFFLTSQTQGLVAAVPGSVGTLCLGGRIGRFIGAGQVQSSGAAGTFSLDLDLTAMPDPVLGLIAAQPGETWSFQAWHRDALPAGGATSNFSSALAVRLR